MKTFNTLADMAQHIPASSQTHLRAIIDDLSEYWDQSDIQKVSFVRLFDHPVYLIECTAELSAVQVCDQNGADGGGLQAAASADFDIAYWTDDGSCAVLGNIETANGGPQYFIPKAIAEQVPYVGASVQMIQQRWAR